MVPQPDILKRLFFQMLRIRMIEERIADVYPEQEMRCPVHLSIGQEAVAVGVCAQLTGEDYALGAHRSHGQYLAKGGDLKSMMAELYGKETGCTRGKGGSMHLIDLSVGYLGSSPIVGSTIAISTGVAFGTQLRGERRVTAVFFGEGATEEGVFQEALNFAALKSLPIVFVCENNLYSTYAPLSVRQADGRSLIAIAQGLGVEGQQGDGNDVVSVYQLAGEAIRKARDGAPVLLELATYRWREHVGPYFDNDLGYRTESEFQEWRARCPLDTLRKHLLHEGLISNAEDIQMQGDIAAEIEDSFAFAKDSPFPAKPSLMEHVYAT